MSNLLAKDLRIAGINDEPIHDELPLRRVRPVARELVSAGNPPERSRLTLDQLRIFVAVAEREHVTQAAQALNLTQSATSSAVAALEGRHGVRLFDRLGRRIVLTAAGKIFLAEARALLAQSAAAERALADLAGLKTGVVSLAASQTVGNYWLPPLLKTFAETYPGLSIRLQIGNTESVAAMTGAGEIDLGFVEGEIEGRQVAATPIGEDEMVVVAAPRLLERLRSAGADWLAGAPWVVREQGSGTREAFEAAMKDFGVETFERRIVLELPSNEAVGGAVAAGAGLAVMSRLVVHTAIESGALVVAPLNLRSRRFFLLRHRERYLPQAARALIRLIEDGASAQQTSIA